MESQRPSGAFPGYAPFPFQHGWDFGSAWADAGVICPWTIWQAYGDTQVIDNCWEPMQRFMQWRKSTSQNDLGIAHGNGWGDWLAQGASTPLNFVDTVYYAISARMMAEMAAATGRKAAAKLYRDQFERTKAAFVKKYVADDGSIRVPTQTAQALALFADLVPQAQREATGKHLAEMIRENGNHMSTGFLGTRPLLPVLSSVGQNDLAAFLFQSHEFPSWGYEIDNGATAIWERWDSYTNEDAFGRHNAAMNSFSHYAFGAVCEWMFQTLAGIRSDGPGYAKIIIRPTPPAPLSNAMHEPINFVSASYDSIRGPIRSDWKLTGDQFSLDVTIPANTTATVYLPTSDADSIRESGKPLDKVSFAKLLKIENGHAAIEVGSGDYKFTAKSNIAKAETPLKTSKPKDMSINPEKIDLSHAKKLVTWDFALPADVASWNDRENVDVIQRDGKAYVVATGDDSKMATTLDRSYSGRLVIALRVMPTKGATSQFFWAPEGRGFNGALQSQRPLEPAEQVNAYLFSIPGDQSVRKLRFDPFATYDQATDKGEMLIESITIYQLPTN